MVFSQLVFFYKVLSGFHTWNINSFVQYFVEYICISNKYFDPRNRIVQRNHDIDSKCFKTYFHQSGIRPQNLLRSSPYTGSLLCSCQLDSLNNIDYLHLHSRIQSFGTFRPAIIHCSLTKNAFFLNLHTIHSLF